MCDFCSGTHAMLDWVRILAHEAVAAREAQWEYEAERDHDIRSHIADLEGNVCLNCGGIITTDTTPSYVYKEKDICDCMNTITAFTMSRHKTWEHTLSIRDSTHLACKVLTINPPVEYNLDTYFLSLTKTWLYFPLLCIDAGGRNYGVHESVYVYRHRILSFLKQQGIVL